MDTQITEIAGQAVGLVVDAHAEVGEGALWDGRAGVLYWVDITRSLVHRFTPRTGQDEVFDVGQEVGAVSRRVSGGLVLAVRDGFATLDTTTAAVAMLTEVEADNPANRMNDGRCDSRGRFWAGTMSFASTPEAGALYRLDPDGRATTLLTNVTISNGIDWSPDDRTLYYIDSPTWGVDAFDYDPEAGAIHNRRRLINVPRDAGMPDGLTVDAEGGIWVALWDGGALRRYMPDGQLERVVRLPARLVTSCAFGGPDLADLYITTGAYQLSPEELGKQPHAGGLFVCRPGVRGKPAHAYAG